MSVTHHDLCFGCGLANLFGLQLEAEQSGEDALTGRFFLKQDHQGPPGFAHGGVLAAALDEAMALLVRAKGLNALTRRLEVDLRAPAPIGQFAMVEARIESQAGTRLSLAAELRVEEDAEGHPVATASAGFTLLS